MSGIAVKAKNQTRDGIIIFSFFAYLKITKNRIAIIIIPIIIEALSNKGSVDKLKGIKNFAIETGMADRFFINGITPKLFLSKGAVITLLRIHKNKTEIPLQINRKGINFLNRRGCFSVIKNQVKKTKGKRMDVSFENKTKKKRKACTTKDFQWPE
jgi:hypothetical protein